MAIETRGNRRIERRAPLRPVGQVSVGQWIRIRVPGEPFPVHMRVGAAVEAPAFIDHEPDGRGGYTAVAAVRCPALPAGVHQVTVRLPDGSLLESAIAVI